MQHYADNVADSSGRAQPRVSVRVLRGGSLATIYSDNGVTIKTNPTTTDGAGNFDFYAANGIYTLVIGNISRSITLFELDSVSGYTIVSSADSAGSFRFVPSGGASTAITGGSALNAAYWGTGQLTTADGNKRGKFFSRLSAAPSVLGSHDSVDTAFNGDLSKSLFQVEHRITGAATLGQPSTGYTYAPETSPFYVWLYNSSGWNNATADNMGRTGAPAFRVKVYQAGQGDAVAYNYSLFAGGTRAGATSFLANPAVCGVNGDASAGADGIYHNLYETISTDNGYDIASIGAVYNFNRTNSTGAKGAWWAGARVQSKGSQPIDVAYSMTGPIAIGLDTSMATLSSSGTYTQAAITLKADQRIYPNASGSDSAGMSRFSGGLGLGDYLVWSSSLSAFNFVAANSSILQIYGLAAQVVCTKPMSIGTDSGDYHRITGGSGAITVTALGSSTDIDYAVVPKGAGLLKYGALQAIAAETVTGYITIKDSGGATRKLAVVS